MGHQTKPGPNPILHRLQQLAVVCSTKKESIHFSVFPPMPQPNSLLLRSSCGGVSNAFSKSKMNVSTCLGEVYIHPDEPWCSSTLCVRVTCKVHKSMRRDDNYMREPCRPFYRGDIYLQETILWGFHPSQETFGRDGQTLDPIQLQAPLGL